MNIQVETRYNMCHYYIFSISITSRNSCINIFTDYNMTPHILTTVVSINIKKKKTRPLTFSPGLTMTEHALEFRTR